MTGGGQILTNTAALVSLSLYHSLPNRDSSEKRPHSINRLSQEPGAASIAKLPPGRRMLLIVMTPGKPKGQGTKASMRMGTGNLRVESATLRKPSSLFIALHPPSPQSPASPQLLTALPFSPTADTQWNTAREADQPTPEGAVSWKGEQWEEQDALVSTLDWVERKEAGRTGVGRGPRTLACPPDEQSKTGHTLVNSSNSGPVQHPSQ